MNAKHPKPSFICSGPGHPPQGRAPACPRRRAVHCDSISSVLVSPVASWRKLLHAQSSGCATNCFVIDSDRARVPRWSGFAR